MDQFKKENNLESLCNELYEVRKSREELKISNQRQQAMMAELEHLEYLKLLDILITDVECSIEKFNQDDNQFTRRSFIRNVFSFIEGNINMLKQEILVKLKHSRIIKLEPEEILVLKEESPQVEKNGKIKATTKYVDLLTNIRVTFRYYTKIFDFKYDLDVSKQYWQIFQSSLKVRNRITHPKVESDMDISNQELVETYISYFWFKQCVINMLILKAKAMKEQKLGEVRF